MVNPLSLRFRTDAPPTLISYRSTVPPSSILNMLSNPTEPVLHQRTEPLRSLSEEKKAVHLANICLDGSLGKIDTLGVELYVYIIIEFHSNIASTYNHIIQAEGCGVWLGEYKSPPRYSPNRATYLASVWLRIWYKITGTHQT